MAYIFEIMPSHQNWPTNFTSNILFITSTSKNLFHCFHYKQPFLMVLFSFRVNFPWFSNWQNQFFNIHLDFPQPIDFMWFIHRNKWRSWDSWTCTILWKPDRFLPRIPTQLRYSHVCLPVNNCICWEPNEQSTIQFTIQQYFQI